MNIARRAVNALIYVFLISPMSAQQNDRPQRVVPAAAQNVTISESARQAVQAIADEVRRGNLKVTSEKMYPRWKNRLAARKGGIKVIEAELEAMRRKMKRDGISIESYKAGVAREEIGVRPGKDGDGPDAKLTTREWLVFVPTVAVWRGIDAKTGKVRRIERRSFQVAIRDKESTEWFFIDGANLGLNQLRGLFPGLPAELLFPPREGKELKD